MPLVRAVLKGLRRELEQAGGVGNLDPGPSPHEFSDSTPGVGRCRRTGSLLGRRFRRMAGPGSGMKGKTGRGE